MITQFSLRLKPRGWRGGINLEPENFEGQSRWLVTQEKALAPCSRLAHSREEEGGLVGGATVGR